MVVVGPLLALLLLSTHALAAPIFFSTGNPGVDGAIAGAGLGLVAGQIQSVFSAIFVTIISTCLGGIIGSLGRPRYGAYPGFYRRRFFRPRFFG